MTSSKGVGTMRHFRRDEGAAAVEFALLFPLFALLCFGTISAGTAFSRQLNITQGAREASRYGATYNIEQINGGSGALATRVDTWLSAVDTAATQTLGGSGEPLGGYDYRCVAIVSTSASGAVIPALTFYKVNGGSATQATGNNGCPDITPAAIPNTSYVQVVVKRTSEFFFVVTNHTVHMGTVSVTPYEGTVA